jgi:polyisoprenoid-binding protein YceI
MKVPSLFISLLLFACITASALAQDQSQRPDREPQLQPVAVENDTAALNATNTMIQFTGTHAGDEPNPRVGSFEKFSGTASIEEGMLTAVAVEIETASLQTPIPDLTNHLKSPDFFDAREHPKAKFESRSISEAEDGEVTITGNLTLLGNTQEVSFPARITVAEEGITLVGNTMLDRTLFGMDKMTERVNKEIELAMAIGKTANAGERPGRGGGRGRGRGGPGGPLGDPEAFFKRLDADGDGQLTGDEMPERMAERMERLDTDGDGVVSLEEFQARMRRFREGAGQRGGERGERPNRPRRPE